METTYYVAELDYGTRYDGESNVVYRVCQFSDVEAAKAVAKDYSETQGPAGVVVADPEGAHKGTDGTRLAILRAFRNGEAA